MLPELEKPRVTEIQVRIDCNGCVQKIKKALNGINGIYDLYIDFPQQKLTIIGWADPEKILKAIKKTRKIATICSHGEPTEPPAQPPGPPPEGGGPPGPPTPEATNPPPAEAPSAEAAPPGEPPKDPPPPPPIPPDNPTPETKPSSMAANNNNAGQPVQNPSGPKDVGEVQFVYHHPPDYGYRYGYGNSYGGYWSKYHNGQGFPNEPPPAPAPAPAPTYVTHNGQGIPHEPPAPTYVTHSYNTYKPSPYVTEYEYVRSPPRQIHYSRMDHDKPLPYVTEYEYVRSPPRQMHYSRMDHYSEDYHNGNNGNGNITSMFSDENPNACRIM